MRTKLKSIILLDRDGVLNRVCIEPEHGTIDSPLHPNQVEILPGVPESIRRLTRAGYGLAIATNQPSAAKGKTTLSNLQNVHSRILELIQAEGGKVLSSHICYHRAEDHCNCRKPKTGLLEAAFNTNPSYSKEKSWIVGDGVTDIEAGQQFGLKTAFLGPQKCDACKIFKERDLCPHFFKDLKGFTDFLLDNASEQIRSRF